MTNLVIKTIKSDAVYKRILADSFGGVMFNANKKYDAEHLLTMWNRLTEAEIQDQDGIIKGVIDFIKGE